MNRIKSIAATSIVALSLVALNAQATNRGQYKVEITNLTQAQSFTPALLTTHSRSLSLFELGGTASTEMEMMAEGGDTSGLQSVLDDAGRRVRDVQTGDGLIAPGETASFTVSASRRSVLSVVSMLIPTNDTFLAANGVRLPGYGSVTYFVPGYDSGTEANDQSCGNMPGPRCGGEGFNPTPDANAEGFIHVSNGFHDLGDVDANGFEVLSPVTYDWRNPVARIKVRRIR